MGCVFVTFNLYLFDIFWEIFRVLQLSEVRQWLFCWKHWKFSEIYNFVQISYFLYSCRVAVFWWKITFDDKVIYWYATQCLHTFILEFVWLTEWVWVILRLYKVSTWYQIIRKLLRFWRIKITSNIKQLGNNCYLLLVSNKFSLRN